MVKIHIIFYKFCIVTIEGRVVFLLSYHLKIMDLTEIKSFKIIRKPLMEGLRTFTTFIWTIIFNHESIHYHGSNNHIQLLKCEHWNNVLGMVEANIEHV